MAAKGVVLIAEDDSLLRDLYRQKFHMHGFDIQLAENGEMALQVLESMTPDLVILDIGMPVMDGFQVLAKLPKADRSFPVIILSNFADKKNRERADELEADAFLIKKNMTIRQLLETAEKLIAVPPG